MNSFQRNGLGFRSQWPRKTMTKKIAKSVVGEEHGGETSSRLAPPTSRPSRCLRALETALRKARSAGFVASSRARR